MTGCSGSETRFLLKLSVQFTQRPRRPLLGLLKVFLVFYAPESPLLLPSLRLFIPPLRLVSAAMWQVIQRGQVQDYGMVEEFITTVSDMVPELLNADQKAELLLGLRARVCLQRSGTAPPTVKVTIKQFGFRVHPE